MSKWLSISDKPGTGLDSLSALRRRTTVYRRGYTEGPDSSANRGCNYFSFYQRGKVAFRVSTYSFWDLYNVTLRADSKGQPIIIGYLADCSQCPWFRDYVLDGVKYSNRNPNLYQSLNKAWGDDHGVEVKYHSGRGVWIDSKDNHVPRCKKLKYSHRLSDMSYYPGGWWDAVFTAY